MVFLVVVFVVSIIVEGSRGLLSPDAWDSVAKGQVYTDSCFLSPEFAEELRRDCIELHARGAFSADGLTDTSLSSQGFGKKDRQTMRRDWLSPVGNVEARTRFSALLSELRDEASRMLGRSLPRDERYHEMTYNWYESGASLSTHLDEYHEDLKGRSGWSSPTRRSITWLVYLNQPRGGQLTCYPRQCVEEPVGAAKNGGPGGDVQVGWLNGGTPVFKDDDGALYSRKNSGALIAGVSDHNSLQLARDILRRKGVDFDLIMSSSEREKGLDVVPSPGKLVVFDSVSVPHQVQLVLSQRQAVTGWMHELL